MSPSGHNRDRMRRDTPFESGRWDAELSRLKQRMDGLPWDTKKDLLKLHRTMEKLIAKIWREEINCRRKGSPTSLYQRLLKELHDAKDIFDQHLIQALLSA